MASTLKITFGVKDLTGQTNLFRGRVNVEYNNGIANTLHESLTQSVPTLRYFREVTWIGGLEDDLNDAQASNFAFSFNRDYRDVGGIKNLTAQVTDIGEVTITAKTGTFDAGSNYTGDVLNVTFGTPNNNSGTTPITLNAAQSPTVGDCSTIEYSATASGGTPPYVLVAQGVTLNASWDGTATTFNLNRGSVSKVTVTDTLAVSEEIYKNVPKNIVEGEFEIVPSQFDLFNDITVNTLVTIMGVTPYEYALSDSDGSNIGAYQTSNIFPGVPLGTYRVYIKDVYGCEIYKIATLVAGTSGLTEVVEDYFLIPKANSIGFLDNHTEKLNIKKSYTQKWKSGDVITTQFKSSFPYHNITYRGIDGSKQSINFLEIQQNIGSKEKIDCVLYDVGLNRAVYFDQGNQYEPNTDTVIGLSPYNNFTPSWVQVGRSVSIDAIGTTTIKSTGFDSDKQKYYFTTELPATGNVTEISARIQATYNIHGYNVFESSFNMAVLETAGKGYFQYEYGLSETEIVGNVCSEYQEILEETCKTLRLEWYDSKNRGNMVFQSGIKGVMNIVGDFYKTSITESELANGDEGSYDLIQRARSGWKLELDLLTPAIWEKLDIITGTEFFTVDGINLKRATPTGVERIGETNYRTFESEFRYGINELGYKQDETVLNISTGVVGGGGSGKTPVLSAWDGKTRLVTSEGIFVEVGGVLIEVNV